jgi:CysZ protein
MQSIITSAFKAARSLFAPGMFRIFILSVLATIAALSLFFITASSSFIWLAVHMDNGWIAAIGGVGSGLLAWFLFPGVMPIIVNFFDDRIATTIERRDYPYAAPKPPEFWPELRHDVRFSLMAIGLNLLALPLYLIPLMNAFVFFILNGYLLGREFFIMVARRYMPIKEAGEVYKRNSNVVLFAGMALVLCAITPVFNLFAPFWGIALMTHLYHRITKPAEILPPYV